MACLRLSIIIGIGALVFFKYTDFITSNINALAGTKFGLLSLALPIGISFYTFQILSYYPDLYRGQTSVQRNLLDFAAYVTLFYSHTKTSSSGFARLSLKNFQCFRV
jgi:alginate O-acetyltransferase complex protein AlgI